MRGLRELIEDFAQEAWDAFEDARDVVWALLRKATRL